ncbi:MAG: polysaccharide deacetylase family protein [Burkholderiaceae bacterium]
MREENSIHDPAIPLRPHERLPFSAIVDRPVLSLPDGARMVVWPVVNIEEWDISRPMPRMVSPPPGGIAPVPDVPNWTWHEYGMRVGVWRLIESFKKAGIKPTLSINARVCETRPRVAQAALDEGWEFMAHCYEQIPIQKIADERAMMEQTLDVLTRFTGEKPRGWLGPGRSQTFMTPDLIKELGLSWFGDWVLDDQPQYVKTRHGPLVSLPYSIELNDINIMLTAHQSADAMLARTKDAFERLYQESEHGARVMAFGVHPYISGATHRIKYFEMLLDFLGSHKDVVFMNGSQICDWFKTARAMPAEITT